MLSRRELLDLQFIEVRAQLIDLAAFLDRVDRHPGDADHRLEALKNALAILQRPEPERARAVLEALSDMSDEIPQSAPYQGATGAPPP